MGIESVVGVATFQFAESLFVSPLDWQAVPGDIETSQLRTLFAVFACAQQSGLILAWEQLLSTPLLPVCDHRVAFRLHVIAQCELKKHQFEELIVMACKGEMRDGGKTAAEAWASQSGDRNAAKRRRVPPPEPGASDPCLPEHYRFIRLADIRRTLGVMTFGSEDAEPYQEFTTDAGPVVQEEGSDGAERPAVEQRGGVFECFAITSILAATTEEGDAAEGDASASVSRYGAWRVWKDETTDHDPRTWESYVDEDGGDCRWFVNPEYGAKAIRYVNFSEASMAFKFLSCVSDLGVWAKPWERPTPDDVRRCILKFASSSDLAVPALERLAPADLFDMVEELRMYENDMPITATQAVGAADADTTVQARLYPHTDRLCTYFRDFMNRVTEGVRKSVLDPSEIDLAEKTCLTRLNAQFTRDIEGYCAMPHVAMVELRHVVATLNKKMSCEAASDFDELKTLRKMAFNPRGLIKSLHPESVDVLHTLSMVREYEGMSASQTRGLTLLLHGISGLNYRPKWDAHARYVLFTGFPGGGKSEIMIRFRLWMPNGAVVQLDMVSQKALYYNGASLDMKVVTLDESPGQVKGQEWLVQAINTCVSKGYMDYTTAVYEPSVRSDGSIASVGGSFTISAAARTVWVGACNNYIIGDPAGAGRDRQIPLDVIRTKDEPTPPPGADTVVGAARTIHKLVTLTIAYGFFASMYGIIVPEKPVMTIFDVFMEMVIKQVPDLSRFHLRHRQTEALRALATKNWMARHAHDFLFPKRNSDEMAWATEDTEDDADRFRRIPDRFFKICMPDIRYLRTLATSTISAVDCVVALSLMQESDTMDRRFTAILIEHLSIHLGDFVRSESPEDEDYRKTAFLVSGSDLRLPAVLIAKCEAQRIPGFSQHKIVQDGISAPVFSGSPMLKIETNPAGKNPSLMIHHEAIKRGFRTPSAGQIEILRRIWSCDAAWDFAEQKKAVISHELWKEVVRKDDGTVDLDREFLAIQQWELEPGRQCIAWNDNSIGGQGYLNTEVAVVVDAQPGQPLPDGYGVAKETGPLGAEGRQVPIKPKTLSRVAVIDGDFYRLIPAIIDGKDVCGRSARDFRKQKINRFLLAAGVAPGSVVFNGTHDLPTPRGDIADLHTVTEEEFLEKIRNPRYVRRRGVYNGRTLRSDPVFAPDDEFVQFSETSNFDKVIADYVLEEYTNSRRPPEVSEAAPGHNQFAAFFGFGEGP